MKLLKSILSIALLLGMAAAFVACSKSDPAPAVMLISSSVSNLAADPPSGGYNPTNGQPIGVTKKYTLFSFLNGVVANSDSASTKWDIGFNGTNIIINNGTSGPATASAQVISGIFDDITLAPDNGYNIDNKLNNFYAIPRGSGNGWYNYNPASNLVTPIAGRVLIIKTTDARYVKMEILSYYQNAPVSPNSTTDKDRYYTFRYVYQADGSKNLK